MFHADALPTQFRFAENDEALPGQDHLLDVMQIEPATDERLAESVGAALFEGDFEDFFPATETFDLSFRYFAAKTNRLFAFLARKPGELGAIFVPPRIMPEQIIDRLDLEPAQRRQAGARNPLDFA